MLAARSFRACEHEVETQVRVHAPRARVETTIEESDLEPNEKAALWLTAWSLVGLEADHEPVEGPVPLG